MSTCTGARGKRWQTPRARTPKTPSTGNKKRLCLGGPLQVSRRLKASALALVTWQEGLRFCVPSLDLL